jgi:release factor glutamine methyltransferase
MNDSEHGIDDVLRKGAQYLERKGVENARVVCETLLARLLQRSRLSLHLVGDQTLEPRQVEAMRRGLLRVAAGEPVQYVVGQADFMGHRFQADRRALIPRPETEVLVRQVLECAPLWEKANPGIADLGVGGGCIVCSLALERPQARYLALDISADAIALARENAEALGVAERVTFTDRDLGDLLEPGTLDALVSNPPYIRTADWEQLPPHIRDHEPRTALDGGPDGLAVLTQVAEDASIVLQEQGRLFLEIGADQGAAVESLLQTLGFEKIMRIRDLAERERVVAAVWPG